MSIIGTSGDVLDFQSVAAFRNQRASQATAVENRVQISHFLTLCKI